MACIAAPDRRSVHQSAHAGVSHRKPDKQTRRKPKPIILYVIRPVEAIHIQVVIFIFGQNYVAAIFKVRFIFRHISMNMDKFDPSG